MRDRYRKILESQPDLCPKHQCRGSFDVIAADVVAPVVVMYTCWILRQAQRLNIRRLYFLARDGYQMFHAAKILCEKMDLDIECSYFYCSRFALRMAAYRFFDDSAYDRLFLHAYRLNGRCLLQRAGFDEESRRRVYEEIGFDQRLEECDMGREEFGRFCRSVRNSAKFREMLREKSEKAYAETVGYIRQEGMHEHRRIGIVDLGWTGSLQHTLRRILDSDNISAEIYGFYLGLLDKPPVDEKSRYLTWLFGYGDVFVKSWFAHNLAECLCSAPHGMTVGYSENHGAWVPVLAEGENPPDRAETIRGYVEKAAERHGGGYSPVYRRIAMRLLRMLMVSPDEGELSALGGYRFCDDVGEQYHRSIVQKADVRELRGHILPFKLFRTDSADGVYWYFGSVDASRPAFRWLYKAGYILTRYSILKLKG